MHRTPLEVLEIAGTATEVAFQLGRIRARKIAERVDYWNRLLAALFKGKRNTLKNLEKGFLSAATKAAQHYTREIHALAEGAGLSFADLFRLNLTELKAFSEKCSTLIIPFATPAGKKILIAHNEDWDPRQNDVLILKARLPDVSYTILAYDGYLPGLSSGLNSHGLCHAINYVQAKDIRPAMPRIFITRFLVTAHSAKECLAWIHKNPRSFGQSIHLAQGAAYTGIEITARRVMIRKPTLPTIHTNHYLSATLKPFVATPSENSATRLKVGRKLLAAMTKKNPVAKDKKTAITIAKRILSDRSGLPYAIWREADHPLDTSATVATAMFGTDTDAMDVYRTRPERSQPLRVKINCP